MNTETRVIKYKDKIITYYLTRKRVKNINLHIRTSDGSVQVSAAKYVSSTAIDSFVLKNAEFILEALKRYADEYNKKKLLVSGNINDGDKVVILGKVLNIKIIFSLNSKVEIKDDMLIVSTPDNSKEKCNETYAKWLNEVRSEVFSDAINKFFPIFKKYCKAKPRLIIKKSVSRWGYYNLSKGVIMLNEQLISAPLPLIEYVALHELTHLVYQNHSKDFWNYMEHIMPDCRLRRKALKSYAFLL